VELAPADDAFLYVLVVVDTPQRQVESNVIRNPPLPRLSPAPKPVTQINRLIRASCIAVTSTWVAFEKSLVGSKMISSPAETPNDWATASMPVSARFTVATSSASPAIFSSLG